MGVSSSVNGVLFEGQLIYCVDQVAIVVKNPPAFAGDARDLV